MHNLNIRTQCRREPFVVLIHNSFGDLGHAGQYLRTNPFVRTLRIIGMFLVLGSLVAGELLTWFYFDFETVMYPIHCITVEGIDTERGLALVENIWICLYLFVSFIERIVHLWYERGFLTFIAKWRDNTDRKWLEFIADDFDKEATKGGTGLIPTLVASYANSFIFTIVNLVFLLVYGLTRVKSARFDFAPTLSKSSNRMEFGQIVALVLLTLPLWTLLEVVFGMITIIFDPTRTNHSFLEKNQDPASGPCIHSTCPMEYKKIQQHDFFLAILIFGHIVVAVAAGASLLRVYPLNIVVCSTYVLYQLSAIIVASYRYRRYFKKEGPFLKDRYELWLWLKGWTLV